MVAAIVATIALGLGMTACGTQTIGYMWILGTFRNEISAFQIDVNSGNLTTTFHSPFSSNGTNPVSIVVGPSGRFVYVVNAGSPAVGLPGTPGYVAPAGAGIAEFQVGGSGILTYQQTFFSQGNSPIWAVTSGNFLYVLDRFAPDYNGTIDPNTNLPINASGSITAFAIAGDTGRLSLITNNQNLNADGSGKATNFFRVGDAPVMSQVGSGNCLYTLSKSSIFPLVIGTNGQLTTTTTGPFQVTGSGNATTNLTSINTGNGSAPYIYLTDAGNNQIVSLQGTQATCALAPITNSEFRNLPGTANPVNSVTLQNGRFLYVINQSSTANTQTVANSTISAYQIIAGTGQLQILGDGGNNPYPVGSGPICLAIDPSNQYLYVTNNTDSTVTGRLINQTTGTLSNLGRGSVFPVTMQPTCLAISGSI